MTTDYRQTGGTPCQLCGTTIDAATASYDKAGRLVCKPCEARGIIVEGDMKATGSIWGGAIVIGVAGILGAFCFNPFYVTSILVIPAAIGWMVGATRLGPEYRRQLGGKLTAGWVLVSVALAINVAIAGMALLLLAGIALR
jgi:hypothetical protein